MTEREIIAKEWRDENGLLHRREVGQELVRCKECKFNYGNEHNCSFNPDDIVCTYWESDGLQSDDFCSYGARMNSSENPNNCERCKWWNESYGCHWKEGVCHYVPKAIIPKQCVSCDSASRIIEAYSQGFKDGADAVKAMPQTYITEDRDTQILDAWQVHHRNTTSVEDEPQTERSESTDCAWK